MIYVTEEQAKHIENFRNAGHTKGYLVHCLYDKMVGLDIVTLARIVEGEPYEIGRAFKVGDIVFSDETNEFYTVENVKGYRLTIIHHRKSGYLFEGDADSFTLVCKAENREDLANE